MLTGKTVIVTGASGGLGASVTKAFLDAGATVVGVARSIHQNDFAESTFHARQATIASLEDARAIVDAVIADFGKLDAVVHLVGGFDMGPTVDQASADSYRKMFDTNFYSALHVLQAALAPMKQQQSGRLIAIGSKAAVEPSALTGAYNVSKAALVSLIRTIAVENAALGISANIVLPGTMDTPANRKAMPAANPALWVQPAQVAALLVHLASDQAAQITGAVIPVYGGS